MLTLNTKYDGVPTISPYVGYAVQVVDKKGGRRVVVGPATILLKYDESLAVLELSTGKPKTTDKLIRDVYLRVDNNVVSDIVRVETNDLVNVDIKLSYRVNFLREQQDKWFSVENYVKYLCDHMRSILKGEIKKLSIKNFIQQSTAVVRDTVLGPKVSGEKRSRPFTENGMEVYDVEVLGVEIKDESIATLLRNAQQKAVEGVITLAAAEQNLDITRRTVEVQEEVAELENGLEAKKLDLEAALNAKRAEVAMAKLAAEIEETVKGLTADADQQKLHGEIAAANLQRRKAVGDYELEMESKRVGFFEAKMEAITPDLIQAMQTLGQTDFAAKLATAIAPLALHEQSGLGTSLEKLFKGTALETILSNIQAKPAKAGN